MEEKLKGDEGNLETVGRGEDVSFGRMDFQLTFNSPCLDCRGSAIWKLDGRQMEASFQWMTNVVSAGV